MAAKRKSSKPTWLDVKVPVSKLDQKDLIKLIAVGIGDAPNLLNLKVVYTFIRLYLCADKPHRHGRRGG